MREEKKERGEVAFSLPLLFYFFFVLSSPSLCIILSILFSLYYSLCIILFVLFSLYCSLCIILSVLFSLYYSLCIILSVLFSLYYSLCIILPVLFSLYHSLCIILSVLFSLYYSLCIILSVLFSLYYSLCIIPTFQHHKEKERERGGWREERLLSHALSLSLILDYNINCNPPLRKKKDTKIERGEGR